MRHASFDPLCDSQNSVFRRKNYIYTSALNKILKSLGETIETLSNLMLRLSQWEPYIFLLGARASDPYTCKKLKRALSFCNAIGVSCLLSLATAICTLHTQARESTTTR